MNSGAPFDVAVVGGGLVGAALARALQGMSVALIAPRPEAPAPFDSRVYAISPGNAAFLAQLGAWQQLPSARLTPVHAMRVFGDDGASLVEFDAYEAGVGELAWIVEDGALQEALGRALKGQEGLARIASASVENFAVSEEHAELCLSDGRTVRAKLVVGADGARSRVRAQAGIASAQQDYGQSAVVANFACARPHRNFALQWFRGGLQDGAVLALLPLPGDHVSMVWSVGEREASRLLALAAAALAHEVAVASQHALGELALATPPRGFPLKRLAAQRLTGARVALAGDSAHVIHPLAGQGANLGLQDARSLAAVLAGGERFRDPGDARLLRRYERSRAEAILAMRAVVHGLYRLFDAKGTLVSRLRNAGLKLTDRNPVIKNILIRHAMG